jgi:DNA gyrase/topoisomerase IV subunit B
MSELTKYKKLSQLEHIRKRPGIYIGNINKTESVQWIVDNNKMQQKEVEWNPGVLKLFDEIISNSVDEHIRSGKVNSIWVTLHPMTGEIVISDDGGIPVEKHPEYGTYIPEMIFGELMSGSNFDDDDRTTAGVNGLGSKLTTIMSTHFRVETCDGKNKFTQIFYNGMTERSAPAIQPNTQKGTTITFIPDYDYFKSSMDENMDKIVKRVYDVAGCNPNITVHLNGAKLKISKFSDYVTLYKEKFVLEENADFSIALCASSNDTFTQISFVNGVDTYNGGTHVDYVTNQIVNKLRELIKKKHKIDCKPNIIKQQLFLIMKCRINAPHFNSQTKEFMCSEIRDFGTSYTPSDKFIKQLFESEIVQKVLNWVEAEKRREELAELKKLNKQTQTNNFLKRIAKFDDATGTDRSKCVLALCEGDSAAKTLLSARDPKVLGVFPLRGKFINVRDIEIKKLASNEEFQNFMAIMGLKIGQKVNSLDELRFTKILMCTDADPDGQHISGLIFNMINEFWPELFTLGVVHKLNAPLVIAKTSKKTYEFFTSDEYHQWAETANKHSKDYYKGLGTYQTADFKRFLTDVKYTVKITVVDKTDIDALDIAFSKSKADERKEWLLQ